MHFRSPATTHAHTLPPPGVRRSGGIKSVGCLATAPPSPTYPRCRSSRKTLLRPICIQDFHKFARARPAIIWSTRAHSPARELRREKRRISRNVREHTGARVPSVFSSFPFLFSSPPSVSSLRPRQRSRFFRFDATRSVYLRRKLRKGEERQGGKKRGLPSHNRRVLMNSFLFAGEGGRGGEEGKNDLSRRHAVGHG